MSGGTIDGIFSMQNIINDISYQLSLFNNPIRGPDRYIISGAENVSQKTLENTKELLKKLEDIHEAVIAFDWHVSGDINQDNFNETYRCIYPDSE